jgi:hypothetical protein
MEKERKKDSAEFSSIKEENWGRNSIVIFLSLQEVQC